MTFDTKTKTIHLQVNVSVKEILDELTKYGMNPSEWKISATPVINNIIIEERRLPSNTFPFQELKPYLDVQDIPVSPTVSNPPYFIC